MHRFLLSCVVILSIAMMCSGCSGVRYSNATYTFEQAPEVTLSDEYKTIYYKLHGDVPDRTYSQLGVTIPGLKWVLKEEGASLIVDVFYGKTEQVASDFRSVDSMNTSLGVEQQWKETTYQGWTTFKTPYRIELYDAVKNVYHSKKSDAYKTKVTGKAIAGSAKNDNLMQSFGAAVKNLEEKVELIKPVHNKAASKAIYKAAKAAVIKKYTSHPSKTQFKIPSYAKSHPALAEVAAQLLAQGINTYAPQALAVYTRIGYDNSKEDGSADAELNTAVMVGMIACHVALGDVKAARALIQKGRAQGLKLNLGYGIESRL